MNSFQVSVTRMTEDRLKDEIFSADKFLREPNQYGKVRVQHYRTELQKELDKRGL